MLVLRSTSRLTSARPGLGKHRLHTRNVLTHLCKLIRLRGLAGGARHAQIELLAAQLEQLLSESLWRLRTQILGLHVRTWRLTNAVDTDSFADARRNASRAISSLMPSISNNTLPGSTFATQYSTLPLPEPMRTSSGFCVIGTSGNTRIQMRPPRFTWREMARRAASISRAVMRHRSVAFRPNSPNATELPRCALPAILPLNCLRNLVRFGCIMCRYLAFNRRPAQRLSSGPRLRHRSPPRAPRPPADRTPRP